MSRDEARATNDALDRLSLQVSPDAREDRAGSLMERV